ncbi:hypothetical protein JCM15765_38050 [Paradesulfitobacterium aromaticivorans]
MLNFCASGLTGGLAIIFLNSALARSPIVIVNVLYNTRVWFAIAISPLLLDVEGKITKVLVMDTVLMIIGTSLIIFGR